MPNALEFSNLNISSHTLYFNILLLISLKEKILFSSTETKKVFGKNMLIEILNDQNKSVIYRHNVPKKQKHSSKT